MSEGAAPRQSVDLLEIFHARRTYRHLLGELRRLRNEDQRAPWCDAEQRDEVERCYEQLVLKSVELLEVLQDNPTSA